MNNWIDLASKGATVNVSLQISANRTTTVPVILAYGHGVLSSNYGDVTLIQQADENSKMKYVAVMQSDTRAWSYEISPPANAYLNSGNVGGTCFIPKISALSNDERAALYEAAKDQASSNQ
jgi:hypothetical protein